MRNAGGNLIIEDPDPWRSRGEVGRREFDTFTCKHCNTVVKVTPATDMCLCKKCMGFVCKGCYSNFVCTPFEKKLEEWEDQVRRGIERDITLKTYGL